MPCCCSCAEAGQDVVRLKGGDPFIFGRGGEEQAYLEEHGITVEVVPGITAAAGCAASAGIPLTHRSGGPGGHLPDRPRRRRRAGSGLGRRWSGGGQTLAIYMGLSTAGTISRRLIEHGRDPQTPVAVIENGTRPEEKRAIGRLADLEDLLRASGITGPALIIVGEVVGLAEQGTAAPENNGRSPRRRGLGEREWHRKSKATRWSRPTGSTMAPWSISRPRGTWSKWLDEGEVAATEDSGVPSFSVLPPPLVAARQVVDPYLIPVQARGSRWCATTAQPARGHPFQGPLDPPGSGQARRFPPRKGARGPVMYRYDEFDHTLVSERVEQFRDQVKRRVAGEIDEDAFKPLRLMNGLYLQLHAYMLRVAIPYGTLSSRQLRKLGHIARVYDKGYGHFTTRQNIQYNWPELEEVPDYPGRAGDGRDARHPDQRQLHPQHHRRPLRRRRGRRDRGPADLRARSSASGPRCTRNSPSCRASSRSP